MGIAHGLRARWQVNRAAVLWQAFWAAWLVFLALQLVACVIRGWAFDAAINAGAIAYGCWLLRHWWRNLRPALRKERRALLAAAAKMRNGEVWLDRDAHVALSCSRRLLGTRLSVFGEDDVLAVGGDGVVVPVTYVMTRLLWEVLRMTEAFAVTTGPDGDTDVTVPGALETQWGKWRQAGRLSGAMRRGLLAPDRAELEQVIAHVAAAERLGRGGDE